MTTRLLACLVRRRGVAGGRRRRRGPDRARLRPRPDAPGAVARRRVRGGDRRRRAARPPRRAAPRRLDLGLLALRLDGTREDAPRRAALGYTSSSPGRSGVSSSASTSRWRSTRARTSLCSSGQGVTGPLVAPIASTALGDLRLVAKLRARGRARGRSGSRRCSTCAPPPATARVHVATASRSWPRPSPTRTFGRVAPRRADRLRLPRARPVGAARRARRSHLGPRRLVDLPPLGDLRAGARSQR